MKPLFIFVAVGMVIVFTAFMLWASLSLLTHTIVGR